MMPQMPALLESMLKKEYGEETLLKIREGFSEKRSVTLRVNPLKASMAEVTAALDAAGIAYEHAPIYDQALILPGNTEEDIRALPIYESGGVYLQSLSSMVPPLLMHLKSGASVLDMAAAPGGKTTLMCALAENHLTVTACEKNKIRADRLRYNLNMQGARGVTVMETDARELSDFFRFDTILLDSPCTGSGTIALLEGEKERRMEAGWIQKTVQTQKKLMKKAVTLLSKGGEMVYSTCSILKEENEQVVQTALDAGMKLVPIDEAWVEALPQLKSEIKGTLTICPTKLYEGFFVARLKKV